jgi:hypothetical protein
MISTNSPASRQRGIVLLLILVGLLLVSSSLLLTVLNNNTSSLLREKSTSASLLEAKEALIAFATLSGEHYGDGGPGPGHLFCPDSNGNGLINSPCGNNALGRLPRTVTTADSELAISDLNGNSDQQFWFGLDDSLRNSPATPFNTMTVTNLTVDGTSGVAAVLIAPGIGLASQSRSSNTFSDYLEGPNSSAPAFVSSNNSSPTTFNDRVLSIGFNEIISPVTAIITETIKIELDLYHGVSGSYPDDTSFDDPLLKDFPTVMVEAIAAGDIPAWFVSNDWLNLTNYVRVNTDAATLNFNGCGITYTVTANVDISRDTRQC